MTSNEHPIVIAYDGSADADLALLWGIHAAELTAQPLRVVVVAMEPARLPAQVREYEEQHALSAAASARDAVKTARHLDAEVVVEHGWTLPVLIDHASTAALMVVGSRGHNLVENHWLGSVSQHLAGHADCDVAVVRPTHNRRAKTILVGVDGSPASVRALRYAAARATITGESILAVHAYQYPMFSGSGLAVLPIDVDTELEDGASRLAAELVAGIAVDFPDVRVRSSAVVGRAARVLARLSDDASLIVVGSRGRTPMQELLLGSVSQETLHRAACPVVVVR